MTAIKGFIPIRSLLPPGFPEIVTLCGSTRFKEAFIEANFRLTREGKLVFSVGWFSHADGEIWGPTPEEKQGFDTLHLRKIDCSDSIFVVNPLTLLCGRCGKPCRLFTELSGESECCRSKDVRRGTYIGESTRNEINYAEKAGKVIRYLEEPSCSNG